MTGMGKGRGVDEDDGVMGWEGGYSTVQDRIVEDRNVWDG